MVRAIRFALFFLLGGVVPLAHACSCARMGGECGAAKPAGTIFLGEVVSRRAIAIPAGIPGRNDLFSTKYAFRIHVTEAFAGAPRAGETVEVLTGGGGGDCGFNFEIGKRYIVDAYAFPAESRSEAPGVTLGTGICTRTQTEETAGILLSELRTEISHGRQPDLHGSVRSIEGRLGYPGSPMDGVTVSLTADKDGMVYRTQTGADGIYSFPVLPADGYRPTFDFPTHHVLITRSDAKPPHIQIPANDGTGMACHFNATAAPTGSITGRVIDADGKGLSGSISVQRLGATHNVFSGSYTRDGSFQIEYLPDGEYTLQFSNSTGQRQGTASVVVQNGAATGDVVLTGSGQNQ
jgi:hypothetical protein